MAQLHTIDPICDARWGKLSATHPRATIFHQPGWLQALLRTYSYEPFVLTSAAVGEPVRDGVVVCLVSSWVTGRRLVSLPFTDHCEPLLDGVDISDFLSRLRAECDHQNFRYLELRPVAALCSDQDQFGCSESYWLHILDLSASSETIFARLHKDCVQRKIRRAEREKIVCDTGNSEQHVNDFFRLLVMTRRRQGLPPQPKSWFKNLVLSLGDKVKIRVARKNETAIAAMLSLEHRSSVIYKYGCSDERFHHLGGMAFLFWNLIEVAKSSGLSTLDLGRSDLHNQGLITFKDRLGAAKQPLTYYSYSAAEKRQMRRQAQPLGRFVAMVPDSALTAVGRLLYRHLG